MHQSTWNDTNQHWIPQFLLRGFGIRKKASRICELDKQTNAISVREVNEVASKSWLLTVKDDQLLRTIENRVNKAVEAIRKGNLDSIGEDGRQTVDKFVCAMMLNDPHGGADAEATREKVIHEGVSDLSEGVQRLGETPDETYFQSSLDEMLGHNCPPRCIAVGLYGISEQLDRHCIGVNGVASLQSDRRRVFHHWGFTSPSRSQCYEWQRRPTEFECPSYPAH